MSGLSSNCYTDLCRTGNGIHLLSEQLDVSAVLLPDTILKKYITLAFMQLNSAIRIKLPALVSRNESTLFVPMLETQTQGVLTMKPHKGMRSRDVVSYLSSGGTIRDAFRVCVVLVVEAIYRFSNNDNTLYEKHTTALSNIASLDLMRLEAYSDCDNSSLTEQQVIHRLGASNMVTTTSRSNAYRTGMLRRSSKRWGGPDSDITSSCKLEHHTWSHEINELCRLAHSGNSHLSSDAVATSVHSNVNWDSRFGAMNAMCGNRGLSYYVQHLLEPGVVTWKDNSAAKNGLGVLRELRLTSVGHLKDHINNGGKGLRIHIDELEKLLD